MCSYSSPIDPWKLKDVKFDEQKKALALHKSKRQTEEYYKIRLLDARHLLAFNKHIGPDEKSSAFYISFTQPILIRKFNKKIRAFLDNEGLQGFIDETEEEKRE